MRVRLALAIVASWAIIALGSQPARAAQPVAVAMHQYRYHPDHVELEVGQPVTWTNEDSAHHDVSTISGPEPFESPLLATGEAFTWTPTVPGDVVYVCTIHDDMTGTITVTAPPPTTVPPTTAVAAMTGPNPSTTVLTTATTSPAPVVIPTRTVAAQASLRPLLLPIAVAFAAVTFTVVLMMWDRRRSV